jgi:hypothetical protein
MIAATEVMNVGGVIPARLSPVCTSSGEFEANEERTSAMGSDGPSMHDRLHLCVRTDAIFGTGGPLNDPVTSRNPSRVAVACLHHNHWLQQRY